MSFSATGDVAIVGAGIVGLSIAFELAERGATVRVYDREEPARAASWAAAGMLAPASEGIVDEAFYALCARSLAAYPAFAGAVRDASGVDPHLHLDGILHAAYTEGALVELSARARALADRGIAVRSLGRDVLLASEPWLATSTMGGVLVEGEGHVDNRRLGRGLVAACKTRGVSIERVRGLAVEADARRVLGIHSDLGFTPAGAIVNACGAWAGTLEGVPADCVAPIVPVKGEMLALAVPERFVRRATWVPGAYLVPRDDGRLLVGATSERGHGDARVTARGVAALLNAALAAAPSLNDFAVTETWAGVRPGTPDGLPVLGATPLDGYYVATGHYRNGILLAPATASAIADAIGGDARALAAFSLARFGTERAPQERNLTA